MNSQLDFPRIIATENSWLITSMSTAAAVLSEKGLLPASALTDFRVNVSGLQGAQQVHSMVQELDHCQDVLFHYLCHSLGREQLLSSVWLQFASRLTNHLITELTRSQIRLLELGKKHFNRHITLSNEEVCLVSELILDFNSLSEPAIDALGHESAVLFLSHDLPNELTGGELSQIFGLTHLSTNLAKFHAEQIIGARLQSIEMLFKGFLTLQNALAQSQSSFQNIAGQYNSNQHTKNPIPTVIDQPSVAYTDTVLASQIKALAHSLGKVPDAWNFTKAMERTTELMKLSLSMGEDLICELFKKLDEKLSPATLGVIPLRLRKVQSHLIQTGHKPADARAASRSLKNYLNHHDISITELLNSEAERIHPSLGPLTMDHLKTIPLMNRSEIKDKAQKSFSETLGKLNSLISKTSQFLILIFFLTSCGVKGSLKSVAEPLRPIVPPMGDSHATPK